MLKNNRIREKARKMEDNQQRFSIRKFSIGAASVLLGLAFLGTNSVQTVHAETISDKSNTVKVEGKQNATKPEPAQGSTASEVKIGGVNRPL